jgi:lipopolysaccharide heptosyltransferase II
MAEDFPLMVKCCVAGKRCDNVLVRGVNWIGDAVMTMPALKALKGSDGGRKISLLVKPWVAPLFEKDPNVDEIILYSGEYAGLAGRLRLAARLRKHRFCSAVLLQNAFDAALIAFLAGIPERIGYRRDHRGPLLTRAVPFGGSAGALHHVDYYLNLLSEAGFEVLKSPPWIYLSLEERLRARESLAPLRRPVVGLNPGAVYGSSKRWPAARFAEVARRVIGEAGGSAVIFGGPSETAIAEEILGRLPDPADSRILVMAGRTSLRELAALISECDVLVTNDSGPMHIGYAVGTPLVAIFGSTSPELTGPIGQSYRVIRKEVECGPCFERECRRGDLKCMDLVGPAEVFEAAKGFVKDGRAVFFDRDGTLCKDAHYLNVMENLRIFPEVESLHKLKEAGFSLIGVTNQSGIARGIVDRDFVMKVNDIFIDKYGFDGFYYCPHHPDEHCLCRKPEPGLLLRARNDFGIDLKKSYVVGDKESDVLLAKSVGATPVLVSTGAETPHMDGVQVAGDLGEAVDIVLGARSGKGG